MRRSTRTTLPFTSFAFALAVAMGGCGPSEISPEDAGSIKVANPSPDNPLKDVTLDNESENLDKIGGMSKRR